MMDTLPKNHHLFSPLNDLIQFISKGSCDYEHLTKTLEKVNSTLPTFRESWKEEFGEAVEDYLETLIYYILNQLVTILSHDFCLPDLADLKQSLSIKRRPNFPKAVTEKLEAWLLSRPENPYPSISEKEILCKELDLSLKQLNDWFINARRRKLQRKEGKN